MNNPPPISPDPKNTEHLRLLVIFHYVWAGLATVCGCGGISVHYAFMRMVFSMPTKPGQTPPPEELQALLPFFYAIPGFFILIGILLNLLSARFLARRQNRTFSLVIAGLNCLQVPFGVALGVFTFVVLLRDSVKAEYEAKAMR